MIDLIIVLTYFVVVLIVALRGKISANSSADEYFLSDRNLPWYSIALSTIATNIQGYQFLGMMGSAYLFGLAQANLEINAVQGILLGAFVFVPLFLCNANQPYLMSVFLDGCTPLPYGRRCFFLTGCIFLVFLPL